VHTAIDAGALESELHLHRADKATVDRFRQLAAAAADLARPKGAYKAVDCEVQGHDAIRVGGILLQSRVLAVHLAEVPRVFPFVATCGREVAEWAAARSELLESYWLETVMDAVLQRAFDHTRKHIVANHGLGRTAVMNPGSLDDWPIEAQRSLFAILGDVEAAVGVRLRQSLMMEPRHSVSGILFPTEVDFQTCMLCDRPNCPKRRAPHDPHLYARRYQIGSKLGSTLISD
ncbi:MAG TPA: hypothetical protein ACFCUC_15950, partial [Desulfobacterales bacterium]